MAQQRRRPVVAPKPTAVSTPQVTTLSPTGVGTVPAPASTSDIASASVVLGDAQATAEMAAAEAVAATGVAKVIDDPTDPVLVVSVDQGPPQNPDFPDAPVGYVVVRGSDLSEDMFFVHPTNTEIMYPKWDIWRCVVPRGCKTPSYTLYMAQNTEVARVTAAGKVY
jgi:hypothetical protein